MATVSDAGEGMVLETTNDSRALTFEQMSLLRPRWWTTPTPAIFQYMQDRGQRMTR